MTDAIDAAAGDLTAWNALHDTSDVRCAAALLMLDPAPPPPALLAAFAALGEDERSALRARAQCAAQSLPKGDLDDGGALAFPDMSPARAAALLAAFAADLSGTVR